MSESGESSSRPTTPVTALPDTARPYRFTYEPSRRGPESVSGTTTDGRDYITGGLANFQLNSTTSLALGALPGEWSSSRHGFHAISTVLNNPHKRQAPPKAHSSLPSVPPAELPRVRRKDFDSYLRAVTPEWDNFQKNIQREDPGPSIQRNVPPLETVPSVFFQNDFNLGDPATFSTVTEQNHPSDDPLSLSHSLPLLEKFSHYADTIELHLTNEIQLRSSSFFAALSNLHQLQSESAACLSQISHLRKLLDDVDHNVVKGGLEMVRLERKRKNIEQVEESLEGIKGTVELTRVARGLVSDGKWDEALELVEDIEEMWVPPQPHPLPPTLPRKHNGRLSPTPEEDGSPPPSRTKRHRPLSIPLSTLSAFSALPTHLRNLTLEISSSLSSELVSVLQSDLQERMEGIRQPKVEIFKERLSPLFDALLRAKGMKEATLSWREVVLNDIQLVVWKQLPDGDKESTRPPAEESNGSGQIRPGLANHLRSMEHSDFLPILTNIYQMLRAALEGLQIQNKIIGEVFESVLRLTTHDSHDGLSNTLGSDLEDILTAAGELSHAQAAKVVSSRTEQHAKLHLAELVEVFDRSWTFLVAGEVICRRMIVGLRGVIVSQSKQFLQNFHQSRLTQSAKLVEDEQWNPSEVSAALQRVVNTIKDGAVSDPRELLIDTTISSPPTYSPIHPSPSVPNGLLKTPVAVVAHSPSAPAVANPTVTSTATSKTLRIEDKAYFTVHATSEVLTLLLDYIRVIVNLGTLTTDTMSRIIEFLKAFNSRTCQVVLGAGAMRSAGLKNITAKHLALASQSLAIMITLIPYVRETFRRHLSAKQAVMLVEFDKLKRDFQEHQNEVHTKLIAIMADRLNAHIKSLQAVDWSVPNSGVNGYMELLVKETTTLHKVLTRYLPIVVVEEVMSQVLAAINHRLSEEYNRIELPHAEAKNRMLEDARYLRQKFSALKNITAPSGMLENVVAEKPIARVNNLVNPVPTPTRSSTLASPPVSANHMSPLSASGIPTAITTSQRLKGLLSGRSATLDKALPQLSPSPASQNPLPSSPSTTNITLNGQTKSNGDAAAQPESAGFRQIHNGDDKSASSASTAMKDGESLPQPETEPKASLDLTSEPEEIPTVGEENDDPPTQPSQQPGVLSPTSEKTKDSISADEPPELGSSSLVRSTEATSEADGMTASGTVAIVEPARTHSNS